MLRSVTYGECRGGPMSLRMIEDVLAVKDVRTHCPLCGRSFQRVASDTEHIFPKWLQHHHDLWTSRLTIPNFTGKLYKSVAIRICTTCNNKRFGQRQTLISRLVRAPDPYAAAFNCEPGQWALWLGKISWLLCRKSHSVDDFRTRNEPKAQRVLPEELLAGTLYLGMFERAFRNEQRYGVVLCGRSTLFPALSGLHSRSIVSASTPATIGLARSTSSIIRPRSALHFAATILDLICLFDGGLHRRFRSHFLPVPRGRDAASHAVQRSDSARFL